MAISVTTNQRGFTLIEMSIVLVIIGLIIGGILKGQELIESSRQKNLLSQIDRLKSGTTTFVDRFRSLPGDFSRASTLIENGSALGTGGNDNGIVGATSAAVTNLLDLDNDTGGTENVLYFNQLNAGGLGTGGSVVPATVNPVCFSGLCTTASPLPASAFPSSGLSIKYGTHEGGTGSGVTTAVAKRAHWFVLSRFSAGQLTSSESVLSGARAFQIDNKYDDGAAGAGSIRSGFVGTGCGGAAAEYAAGSTVQECVLLFTLE